MQNKDTTKKTLLIIVTGLAGSGKSTLCKQIAEAKSLPYLDYDTLTEPFLQKIHNEVTPELSYSAFCASWRAESYAVFWNTVAENLRLKINIVASAPCTQEMRNTQFFSLYKRKHNLMNIQIINIHLVPSEARLHALVQSRALNRDAFHLEHWKEFYKTQDIQDPVWDCDIPVPIHFSDAQTPFAATMSILHSCC